MSLIDKTTLTDEDESGVSGTGNMSRRDIIQAEAIWLFILAVVAVGVLVGKALA